MTALFMGCSMCACAEWKIHRCSDNLLNSYNEKSFFFVFFLLLIIIGWCIAIGLSSPYFLQLFFRIHNLSPFTYCAHSMFKRRWFDFLCAFLVVVVLVAAVDSLAAARNVCSCQHNYSVIALNVAFMLAFHTFLLANCSVYQNQYSMDRVLVCVCVCIDDGILSSYADRNDFHSKTQLITARVTSWNGIEKNNNNNWTFIQIKDIVPSFFLSILNPNGLLSQQIADKL